MSSSSRRICLVLLLFVSLFNFGCENHKALEQNSPEIKTISEIHLINDIEAVTSDGLVQVVVEIPAGTNAKWQVNKSSGKLEWEIKNNKPRVVNYLAYPFNYGMIPQTLLPKKSGGDGDPLDVIVLGPSIKRGTVVPARLIGVLKLQDSGEQDDKLIAVLPDSIFSEIYSLQDLNKEFNGVTEIVELWLINYKGAGAMESNGFADTSTAKHILNSAVQSFNQNN